MNSRMLSIHDIWSILSIWLACFEFYALFTMFTLRASTMREYT